MSILGHDALGHWALGHPPEGTNNITLPITTAAFVIAGQTISFNTSEAIAAGAMVIAGVALNFKISEAIAAASYTITGNAISFGRNLVIDAASYLITGYSITLTHCFPPWIEDSSVVLPAWQAASGAPLTNNWASNATVSPSPWQAASGNPSGIWAPNAPSSVNSGWSVSPSPLQSCKSA